MSTVPAARRGGFGYWASTLLGIVFLLIGLVLTGGGGWLVALDGSTYYLIAGIGLILSGILLMLHRAAGVWLYVLVFVGTVVWAYGEVELDAWALVPRIVAPTVLLVLAVPLLGVLHRGPARRKLAWSGLALCVLWIVGAFAAVYGGKPSYVVAGPATPPSGAPIATEQGAVGADWTAYGGTYAARRYSPLNGITAQNVGQLAKVWEAHTGDLPKDMQHNGYGAETTPLKVGDTLYMCSAKNIMIALDPATGAEKWRYDPQVKDGNIPYTAACRGVAYYTVPDAAPDAACATRVIEGTLDARLVAVDARTGKPCADFGTDGAVDTSVGFGESFPGLFSITSAPTIVRGVIVTGHQVLDGQKNDAPSGTVLGYDAVTGAFRWAWDMGRPDDTGMPAEGQTFTRGTPNSWTTSSGDEELGFVYVPTGNSAADYWSSDRAEFENRYNSSIVAIDVTTGKVAWSFQTVHKDVWDYDMGAQATLIDFPKGDGTTVPALVLPSKQGDIYILDRRSGQPLTEVKELPAPTGGGVEPEQRSPTQPHSEYATLRRADDLSERKMWGMSPIDQMVCRIQFRRAKYQGFYTPPTDAETRYIEYPGYNGGSDWGGIAVDPNRGIIVANYNDMPNYNRLVPRAEADARGWAPRDQARGGSLAHKAEGAGDPQMGVPYAIDVNAGWRLPYTGMLCKQPPYGGLRAIDLRTGKTIWDRPLGSARRNGPFGIPSGLTYEIGTPNNGGSLVTAGGVIFVAATTDNLIRAVSVDTGETLWQAELPAGGQATPMTYEYGGRQYLVIMAGGHHFMETPIGDSLVAYALPQK